MATGFKEKMLAVLDVEATREMRPIDKKFIESNPALKKHYQNFAYKEEVQLDKRKWTAAKLKKDIVGAILYELKILAVQVARIRDAHEKSTAGASKAEAKASTRSMMQIVKSMKEVEAKLAKAEKRLKEIKPVTKGKAPAPDPKVAKEIKALESDIKKLESEHTKIVKERDGLEDQDRSTQRAAAQAAKNNALPMKVLKDLKDAYDDLNKEVANKCSLALEELASGNDKGAAKKGKAAMDRLKNPEKLKLIFKKPRDGAVGALTSLENALKVGSDGDPKVETAYKASAATLKKVRASFDKSGKEVQNAIDYLIKTSEKKDLKESAVMGDFVQKIKDEKSDLKYISECISSFDKDITDWYNEVSSKGMTSTQAKSNKDEANLWSKFDSYAVEFAKTVKDLHDKFKEVEKDLK